MYEFAFLSLLFYIYTHSSAFTCTFHFHTMRIAALMCQSLHTGTYDMLMVYYSNLSIVCPWVMNFQCLPEEGGCNFSFYQDFT